MLLKNYIKIKKPILLNTKFIGKKLFLAMSNLNAAFQRLTQDPKSKQKESGLIYDIVTLNHTMLSAIASIGSYILNHKTTPASKEFDIIVSSINASLKKSALTLEKVNFTADEEEVHVDKAQQKLSKNFDALALARDKDIEAGKTEIDKDTLLNLQESHLISNQLIWLKTLSENLRKVTVKYTYVFK